MISAEKQMLRLRMLESLRAMSDAERAGKSLLIAKHLSDQLGSDPGVVFGFAPLKLEADWTKAAGERWQLALPRVAGDGLRFHRVQTFANLVTGRFGTREPAGGEIVLPAQADIVLVPGVAFNRLGARLGRGGGFYDRFLDGVKPPSKKIAICFSCQLVERVPVEPHDAAVDAVVTEDGWIDARSSGRDRD
jgi:5-formyltetrahydrofolate cyclo-ligase